MSLIFKNCQKHFLTYVGKSSLKLPNFDMKMTKFGCALQVISLPPYLFLPFSSSLSICIQINRHYVSTYNIYLRCTVQSFSNHSIYIFFSLLILFNLLCMFIDLPIILNAYLSKVSTGIYLKCLSIYGVNLFYSTYLSAI